MKFLQTKPQVKSININFCDLYYTLIKDRDEIVVEQLDSYDQIVQYFNDNIIRKDDISNKPRERIVR